MKAISVLQPWAQLLVLGAKKYETRSWKTRHRGPLLIHAGRTFADAARALCGAEPFRRVLARAGIRGPGYLARGVLLGAVVLEDCVPTDQVVFDNADEQELAFGDFRPGRWAWRLAKPTLLAEPMPYQGMRGIFDVPDSVCSTLGSACSA